jgi:hypothetical protein
MIRGLADNDRWLTSLTNTTRGRTLTCRRAGGAAADLRVYCAAAAVWVSRKAGITSFAKRSRSAS